jgi:hypothetical protein
MDLVVLPNYEGVPETHLVEDPFQEVCACVFVCVCWGGAYSDYSLANISSGEKGPST